MAVYTKLDRKDVEEFISRYDDSGLVAYSGIEAGIENTNYFVQTKNGKHILTIFERRVDKDKLQFFIDLTSHFRAGGINCPVTLKDREGIQVHNLKGKKASLVLFLEGEGVTKIEDYHIEQLGTKVANMHLAALTFKQSRTNDMALSAWKRLFELVGEKFDKIEAGLTQRIAEEIYFLAANWPFNLPQGVIHADIFPDNVFFKDEKISGIIDFYFACSDAFAYDIAIIFNAWNLHNDARRQALFLQNYEQVRPLSMEEKNALPVLLRGAALRFLLTRTYDWFNTPEDAQVKKKDPLEYVEKLAYLAKPH